MGIVRWFAGSCKIDLRLVLIGPKIDQLTAKLAAIIAE
jgi:hypothetical protein